MIVTHVKKRYTIPRVQISRHVSQKNPKNQTNKNESPKKNIPKPPKTVACSCIAINSSYFVDLDYTVEIGLGITGGILLVIIIIGTLCYR